MFVEYGIAFFPVYLTLDESIALELGAEESMECVNQEEFEKILEKMGYYRKYPIFLLQNFYVNS